MNETTLANKYDSRKYKLARTSLWAFNIMFAACLLILWNEKQATAVPTLFGGYGTGLGIILGAYGVSNVAARWAGEKETK